MVKLVVVVLKIVIILAGEFLTCFELNSLQFTCYFSLQCHPGSCPKCEIFVERSCCCGKSTKTYQCSQKGLFCCSGNCEKYLNCGVHKCEQICHEQKCGDCTESITNVCYCGKNTKNIVCSAMNNDSSKQYSCFKICDKQLSCGNHKCSQICHEGDCKPCQFSPDEVSTCPCSKTPLLVKRVSCLDEIPLCNSDCKKQLKCGPLVCKI